MQTTKVTMLRNPASSAKCNLSEGETGYVPSSQAEWLVAMGLAVLVDAPKEIKAKKEAAVAAKAERVGEVLATAKDGAEREKIVLELVKTSKTGSDLAAIAQAWGLEGKVKSGFIHRWAKQYKIGFRK